MNKKKETREKNVFQYATIQSLNAEFLVIFDYLWAFTIFVQNTTVVIVGRRGRKLRGRLPLDEALRLVAHS